MEKREVKKNDKNESLEALIEINDYINRFDKKSMAIRVIQIKANKVIKKHNDENKDA